MQNVEQAMGEVQLQFMWFSTDRTLYKYSNSPKTYNANATWKKFKKQMNAHDNFFIVATTTKKSNSDSGYSYDVLGILASLADMEELQKANDPRELPSCYANRVCPGLFIPGRFWLWEFTTIPSG